MMNFCASPRHVHEAAARAQPQRWSPRRINAGCCDVGRPCVTGPGATGKGGGGAFAGEEDSARGAGANEGADATGAAGTGRAAGRSAADGTGGMGAGPGAVGATAGEPRWADSASTARTGPCRFSASDASRWPTDFSTYPDAISTPTGNGFAGLPSTAMSAAPSPLPPAMTPRNKKRSDGPGPAAACIAGCAPSNRAMVCVFDDASAAPETVAACGATARADVPLMSQPQYTTPAIASVHSTAVTSRTSHLFFIHKIIIQW
jgi:hypothetical protein